MHGAWTKFLVSTYFRNRMWRWRTDFLMQPVRSIRQRRIVPFQIITRIFKWILAVTVDIYLADSRTRGIMSSCPDVIVDERDHDTRISCLVFHILHVTWIWKLETNALPCYTLQCQSTLGTFIYGFFSSPTCIHLLAGTKLHDHRLPADS